jgi:hypothetical protein
MGSQPHQIAKSCADPRENEAANSTPIFGGLVEVWIGT